MKLLNTMISVCHCLRNKDFATFLGLERITSHLVEQFFGNYRSHFFGNYQYKTAFRYVIRTIMSTEFQNDLGTSFAIPTRDNYSGTHLNYVDSRGRKFDIYDLNSNYDVKQLKCIAKNIFDVAFNSETDLYDMSNQFLTDIVYFAEKYPSFVNMRYSITKGSNILPKIIAAGKQMKQT